MSTATGLHADHHEPDNHNPLTNHAQGDELSALRDSCHGTDEYKRLVTIYFEEVRVHPARSRLMKQFIAHRAAAEILDKEIAKFWGGETAYTDAGRKAVVAMRNLTGSLHIGSLFPTGGEVLMQRVVDDAREQAKIDLGLSMEKTLIHMNVISWINNYPFVE
ncbi:hypothetical protein BD410DRAFT_902573 [Rickenella mellea]|uniref:Uncharacterized protein n=1 Tax=Rickenella mellea TaxID=50990 RepID=A0A4Y7PJT2_9AGAM|nr:hypothetical protein BD410DRAFT_902573 [Rickenella mellea]